MDRAYIEKQINIILCKEFQSIWLINLENQSLEIFVKDESKTIPGSLEIVASMNYYDKARVWYINNCVTEHSKERMFRETEVNYILSALENNKNFSVEYSRNNNGEINFNQLCYDKIVDPKSGDTAYIIMGFRNIDVTKRAEIDDLTGTFMRPVFLRKAEEMINKYPDRQYDIVISDIVDFKKINETYGTDVADEILRWQGTYWLSFRSSTLLIGRYGGDQIALFGTHESIMSCISDSNREKYEKAKNDNKLPYINVKFGIYLDIKHGSSIISACDKAHMALNSIKHHYDRDIAYFDDVIRTHLEKQRRIEESMYDSLKNGDFKVYYQPKHNSKTGELVGAEALIRWIHPEYGFMSPADFIPLFEHNGFIVENDRFVWFRTCDNLRRWQDKGIKTVPISINCSKLTMNQDELTEMMEESVARYQLRPEQLHVEITETLMEDDTTALIEKLNKIRALGFKVELDDFGSGYSSLNVLSTLPLDIVKLDMSFMQQFGDKKRFMVLESCIDLAKKLGFETVSEGVEIKEQQEVLGRLGADMIQGYYYSKPLPEDEFEKYIKEHL